MNYRQTFNNQVLIKLDPENDRIKLKGGGERYVDTNYEPEKHATVTGIVWGLPSRLRYTGIPNRGMPWLTDMEVNLGDRVVIYYLSIVNALNPQNNRCMIEGEDRYVLVPYDKIYSVFGEGFVRPVNGYVLVEPVTDPFIEELRARMNAIGLEAVIFQKKSNTHVTFAKVKYMGAPIREYVDENSSDEGVDIAIGETVVLRKTYDVPLEYSLHAKLDGGKLLKVQRRNILAKT